jgi:hypothetical protein
LYHRTPEKLAAKGGAQAAEGKLGEKLRCWRALDSGGNGKFTSLAERTSFRQSFNRELIANRLSVRDQSYFDAVNGIRCGSTLASSDASMVEESGEIDF